MCRSTPGSAEIWACQYLEHLSTTKRYVTDANSGIWFFNIVTFCNPLVTTTEGAKVFAKREMNIKTNTFSFITFIKSFLEANVKGVFFNGGEFRVRRVKTENADGDDGLKGEAHKAVVDGVHIIDEVKKGIVDNHGDARGEVAGGMEPGGCR